MPHPHSDQAASCSNLATTADAPAKKAFTKPGKPFLLFSTLPYYLLYLFYFLAYISLKLDQNTYWLIGIIYVGIPILDFISQDWLNPDTQQYKALENDIMFKMPLVGLIILDNVFFVWMLQYLSTNEFSWIFYPGAIFVCGVLAGSNFLIAHELFHKTGTFNRLIGSITMAKSLYMHFYIEHNFGHHKNVATPNDPATALYQESLYQYLPRTLKGGFKSAWNIEKRRLLKIKGFKTHWVPQNKMIWFTLDALLLPCVSLYFLGLKGLIIHLAVAAMSIVTLETINYIEHYGLMRKQVGPGEYERVNIRHSWNAPQRFSNYLLFKLQRHSDHHENAYKPYQVLSSKDESPMLPHGYTLCQIISFFPSVWFRIMDRILLAYKQERPLTKEEIKANNVESYMLFGVLGVAFLVLWALNEYYNKY